MANDITTNTFVDGDVASADGVNTNFDDLAEMKNAKAIVQMSGTQSVATGSLTLLEFDTEVSDPGGNYTNTSSNYRFVAPVTGYYLVTAIVYISSLGNGKGGRIYIHKDGTEYLKGEWTSGVTAGLGGSVSGVVLLSATNYLDVRVYHNNGGNLNVGGATTTAAYASYHLLSV